MTLARHRGPRTSGLIIHDYTRVKPEGVCDEEEEKGLSIRHDDEPKNSSNHGNGNRWMPFTELHALAVMHKHNPL